MGEHTKDSWFRFLAEDPYYAGGATDESTDDYEKKPVLTWDDLGIISPFPMGEQTMPYSEFEREVVKAAGDDILDVHLFNKARKKKDASNKFYVQNKVFLDAALSGAAGEPGDSFLVHYKKPEGEFEAFGLIVQEYTFEFTSDGFPSESISWHYYDADEAVTDLHSLIPTGESQSDGISVISTTGFTSALADFVTDAKIGDVLEITGGVGGGDNGKYVILEITDLNTIVVDRVFPVGDTDVVFTTIPMSFLTSHPLTFADIGLTVEVDGGGATAVNKKTCTLKITNELEEMVQGGAWLNLKPAIKSRAVTLDVSFQTYTELDGLEADTRTELVPQLNEFVLTLGSVATITLTNVYVTEVNVEKIPEFGFYEYTLSLSNAENFSIVVS